MRESVWTWWRAARTVFGLWRQRMRQRDELSRMTGRELSDAGISRFDAWFEIGKPFWRA